MKSVYCVALWRCEFSASISDRLSCSYSGGTNYIFFMFPIPALDKVLHTEGRESMFSVNEYVEWLSVLY